MTDDSANKSTDEEEKAPMVWCSGKLGAAVTLSGDQRVCSRSSTSGWGVQLASEWLTKDIHTVALACEQLDGDAFIGVVGRNFYPSDWDVPLSQTKHAVAMDVKTGRFTHKGANTSFVLRCGSRLAAHVLLCKSAHAMSPLCRDLLYVARPAQARQERRAA